MKVIGVTGGIGTGKSVVAEMLRELGAVVISADQVGHEAYLPGTEALQVVVAEFGNGILQPTGEVDRKKLGAIVFGDPKALARLNAIMHPRMYRMIEERINRLRAQAPPAVVVEAAVLIEAGWLPLVEELWVVTASEETVVQRVQLRNNLTAEQIRERIRSQLSTEERAKHAQVVLENDGDLAQLRARVRRLWQTRVNGRA